MQTNRAESASSLPAPFFRPHTSTITPAHGRKRSTTTTTPPNPLSTHSILRSLFSPNLKSPPASPATTSLSTPAHIRVPHSIYRLQPESHYRDPSARRRHDALLGAGGEVTKQVVRSGSSVWVADWKEAVADGESDSGDGSSGDGESVFGAARGFVLEGEGEEGHFAPRGTLVGAAAWEGLGGRGGEVDDEEVTGRLEEWMGEVGEVVGEVAGSTGEINEVGGVGGEEGRSRSEIAEVGDEEEEGSVFFTPEDGDEDTGRETSERGTPPSLSGSARIVSVQSRDPTPIEQFLGSNNSPGNQTPDPITPLNEPSELQRKDSDEPLSIHYRTRSTMPTELSESDLLTSNPKIAEDHDLDLEALSAQLSDLASIAREDEDEFTPLTYFPSRRSSSVPYGLSLYNPPPHTYRDHARTPSPSTVPAEEEPEQTPTEVVGTGVRHHRSLSLPLSPQHRQLSNLCAEDTRFQHHRDSFELARHRLRHQQQPYHQHQQYEEQYPHYRVDLTGSGAVTGSGTLAMAVPEGCRFSRRASGEAERLSTIWDASPTQSLEAQQCEVRTREERDVESWG